MKNPVRLHHKESPAIKIQKIQFPSIHSCRETKSPEKIASMRAAPGMVIINKKLDCYYTTKETKDLFKILPTFHLFPEENGKNPHSKMREIWKSFFLSHSTQSERPLSPIICKNLDRRGNKCYQVIRSFPIRMDKVFSEVKETFLLVIIETISRETNINQFKLTKREREVVGFLMQGLDYNKVGEKLFVSTHTVQTHIKNIKRKLKVNCKLSLILKVLGIEEKMGYERRSLK